MTSALYNEIDPYAAKWLRNLILNGNIANGDIFSESIERIEPDDIPQSWQFHAFAGIGAWSHALRLSGWPDNVPVWTGSCPCQPFSISGKKKGFADKRHLWPEWFRLIKQCRPRVIFGEQVASADGLKWLDLVSSDMEAQDYSVGSADLCAASVGAPHKRQRLYFVAHDNGKRRERICLSVRRREPQQDCAEVDGRRKAVLLGDANSQGLEGRKAQRQRKRELPIGQAGMVSFWDRPDWVRCIDGKERPVESGTLPLANGSANRVGRVRAYGNAIVAPLAATFITAAVEAINEQR